MNVSIEQAYETATKLLGEVQVENALLHEELARVTADLDEAARRIVELTTGPGAGEGCTGC